MFHTFIVLYKDLGNFNNRAHSFIKMPGYGYHVASFVGSKFCNFCNLLLINTKKLSSRTLKIGEN